MDRAPRHAGPNFRVFTCRATLESTLPALLALLDVSVDDVQWHALDPPQRRRRTLDAVKRLLLRESQMQPVLMVFEDLHWMDGETKALLDGLIESLPTARFLLVVNYRPEYQHGWGSKSYYTQLHLDALRPESADQLLLALLGTDATVEPIKTLLIARTGGNPLFLEESVRALVETGALVGGRGEHRLARPLEAIDVPATVQAILASRIDRLDPEDKQVLQIASVVGKDVPFALLLGVAELPEEDLRRVLAHLQAAEFLYETRLFPDLEYTFKHALTHEVAYGGLLHGRRRSLHAQIVRAIEQTYAERLMEQVDRLAHHATRGGIWEKAVTYSRQCGAKARFRSATREAVVHLEQALEAVQHLPESRERQEQAVDIRLEMAGPLFALGDLERREQCLREAEALVAVLEDQRRDALVSIVLAHQFWIRGDQDQALERGRRAVSVSADLGDANLQAAATGRLGMVYYVVGGFAPAIELFKRSLAVEDPGVQQGQIGVAPGFFTTQAPNARVWLACTYSELGEFAEAARIAQEGLATAEAINDPWWLVHAYYAIGLQRLLQGNLGEAIAVLERGVQLSANVDMPISFALIAPVLGAAYSLAGRPHDGIPLLEKACDVGSSMGAGNLQSRRVCWLGEARLLTDRIDDAMKLAEQALYLARKHKESPDEARAHRLLGEVAIYRDPPHVDVAEGNFRHSIELARKLGMRPLVAHCHLGLGKLYRRTDKREEAQEHLTRATTMYREMGVTYWLEQAEAEMTNLAREIDWPASPDSCH